MRIQSFRLSGSIAAIAVALLLALVAPTGCRSGSAGGGGGGAAATQAAAEKPPPKGVAPPADHRMAKIEIGMTTRQVEEIMGAPDNEKHYVTGKAFNPFNFGSDSGSRLEYANKGEGRVVFAIKKFSGRPAVERIDYDPNEDGA